MPVSAGKEYGTQLLQFAVDSLDLPAIYLVCHRDKDVSNHLSNKLGFRLAEQREDENLYLLPKESH